MPQVPVRNSGVVYNNNCDLSIVLTGSKKQKIRSISYHRTLQVHRTVAADHLSSETIASQ